MKNQLYFLTLFFVATLIVSCSDETSTDATEDGSSNTDTSTIDSVFADTVVADTLDVEPEIREAVFNLDSLMMKFDQVMDAPLNLDSVAIEEWYDDELRMISSLNYKEIEFFSQGLLKHSRLHDGKYTLENFMELDSIKRYNGYEEYMENIDLAMTVIAEANALKKLMVSENKYFMIWGVYTATYEACPYYSGTLLFATLVENNEVKNTTLVGEISGGADAPYWGSTMLTSTIDTSGIHIQIEEMNGGDYDEETEEEIIDYSEESYRIVFGDLGLEVEEEVQ